MLIAKHSPQRLRIPLMSTMPQFKHAKYGKALQLWWLMCLLYIAPAGALAAGVIGGNQKLKACVTYRMCNRTQVV